MLKKNLSKKKNLNETKETKKTVDKNSKKSKKNEKAKKKTSVKDLSFFMEKTPYYISPSFITHNGRHASILKLYVKIGTNRQMDFTNILDFIPINALKGVEMHFLTNDQLIKYDQKTTLIKTNSSDNIKVNENDEKDQKKLGKDDKNKESIRKAENIDYLDYQTMMEDPEPVVVYEIKLMIIADSRELIDEQIEILNLGLNVRHSGSVWDSIGGDQLEQFTQLFNRIEINQMSNTSTGYNYAGLNFAVSRGIFDDKGVPIGLDALSLSESTSIFDFDTYLNKLAIVSIPRSSIMGRYYRKDSNIQISASSIVLQAAANQILMNGRRSHHLVLNDFDYREKGMFYRPIDTNDMFEHYDVSKVTINPLQGFGEIEDVTNVFNRLTNKIVNIFDLLKDLTLDKGERAAILQAVSEFYFDQGYWLANADKFPKRTQIVNISKPSTYATMGRFIDKFSTLMKDAIRKSLNLQADRINSLEAELRATLDMNMSVIGRPTSIKTSNAPQVYYDFNRIESAKIKQVQFINLLEYVIHSAKKGDTIFIHGMDQLYEETVRMSKTTIEAAWRKGIRFVFGFDTVSSQKAKKENYKEIDNMCDVFALNGVFYDNLSTEVDWLMIGKCLPSDVEKFSKATVMQLGTTVENRMQANASCQVLLHRWSTKTNNFVHLNNIKI